MMVDGLALVEHHAAHNGQAVVQGQVVDGVEVSKNECYFQM
jgi:hypothetical protein